MAKYNGHKNWNHWNVCQWINGDEGLYREAMRWAAITNRKEAAASFLKSLHSMGVTHTPDGAPYSVTTIRAALRGI